MLEDNNKNNCNEVHWIAEPINHASWAIFINTFTAFSGVDVAIGVSKMQTQASILKTA